MTARLYSFGSGTEIAPTGQLEQEYYRLKAISDRNPTIDNMRATLDAYDRWHREFMGKRNG